MSYTPFVPIMEKILELLSSITVANGYQTNIGSDLQIITSTSTLEALWAARFEDIGPVSLALFIDAAERNDSAGNRTGSSSVVLTRQVLVLCPIEVTAHANYFQQCSVAIADIKKALVSRINSRIWTGLGVGLFQLFSENIDIPPSGSRIYIVALEFDVEYTETYP